jgi:hypothetical protein
MIGMDADLFDVAGTVDDVEQQVSDRSSTGSRGHERAAARCVRRELVDRPRLVVGDRVHPERSEELSRGELDLDQHGELLRTRCPDDHGRNRRLGIGAHAVHNSLVPCIPALGAIAAVAVGAANAAPSQAPASLAAAAPTLVPHGSGIVVAQEMDATFGIVAYTTQSGAAAFAVRWRGRWVKERSRGIRFANLLPGRGRTVPSGTKLVFVRVESTGLIVRSGLWVDGQRVQSVGAAGEMAYVANLRRGVHTVAVFEATSSGAAATAWLFATR